MKIKQTTGVITGDLVNSTAIPKKKKEQMELALRDFMNENANILLSIAFYRGDSFQLMVKKEKAATIAVTVQAIVFSTTGTWARLSIGIGTFSHIVENNVLRSEGEAFVLSGHQLDKMKQEGRLMKIAINNNGFRAILDASFYLAECIIKEWKPGQVAVISQIPFTTTQKKIAEKLEISEAAVSKALKSSNWAAIENFGKAYEETIKTIFT